MDRNRIKILNFITVFSIGGATEHVVISSEGLKKLGYDVSVITGPNNPSEGSMFAEAESAGISVEVIPFLKRNISLINDIRTLFFLKNYLKKNNFNIIQTHSSKAGIIGRLAASMAGTSIIIHTIHGLPYHEYQNPIIRWAYIFFEKFASKFCTHFMAVTNTIIERSLKNKIGKREMYSLVRSSLDVNYLLNLKVDSDSLKDELGIDKNDRVIGMISRFSKLKGHNYFFEMVEEVIKKNKNVKFLLIGSGELESYYKDYSRRNGLSKYVIFTGLVDYLKVPNYISIMDIVVHTSLLEGLARIMPQSFILEKPIVSFDIDGAHEIIEHGKNGYLVEPKNIHQLTAHIEELINDQEKCKEFGKHGKGKAIKEWDKEKMIKQIDEIYIKLISQRNSL